ncbi:P-loop containing nucleoside triphosphate hydrolase protein [Apiosordaria backusii]|uniref:P-loop containing nucleoside triphosphate hydrolase protein n=1 Tax=Apiosordaria backusii TaxID=314023 RepID=A0AA40BNG8_9PEZI|nr:P-loop containing nucleoside triphosphate hydrolase protein [Apiosordaria backusii]
MPELPTPTEVLKMACDDPPSNPVDCPWPSKDAYLAAQYGLVRFDAIEGLRFSVRVRGFFTARSALLSRVEFSTPYNVQWKTTKRLMDGNLVALSTKQDNFRTICKIATVAQRPYAVGKDFDPMVAVDLIWANPEDAVIDPALEMVMIESRNGYFEASRHTMLGLQHFAQTESPLDKYLIGTHTMDTLPESIRENPVMNLSSLVPVTASNGSQALLDLKNTLKNYDIMNKGFPTLHDVAALDESQLDGLHRVLSNELAIVQGPPGTGKTFTSVQALKVLVANRRKHGGPPIIVAAHTNHALDQLLTFCLEFEVLRLGGFTKSEDIKKCTTFERQRAERGSRQSDTRSRYNEKRRLERRQKELIQDIKIMLQDVFCDRLIDPDRLLEAGVITQEQHDSLKIDSRATNPLASLEPWLGESLVRMEILRSGYLTRFEFDEADLCKHEEEYELDENDMVHATSDQEEEQLRIKGEFVPLEYVWSAKSAAALSTSTRAALKNSKEPNLYSIKKSVRGEVYRYLQTELLKHTTRKFASLLGQYTDICKQLKALSELQKWELVQRQKIDIVGCTTTGLTKYRGLLAALQPKSLLIEEAAETREVDIVSALYPSIEQLILIGDHQQLQPKCNVLWLASPPQNFTVSLFERLVNLGMRYTMLRQQRRMKPELRMILDPFYPGLLDHPVVLSPDSRPDVPGMGDRSSWLFHHEWPEETSSDSSKFNREEARMITHFASYLVKNDTPPASITVLTFYNGQRMLLNKLKEYEYKISTVDSYQGEENDIVILSLVRSPGDYRRWRCGFLEDKHRAVVAISRARRGFYVFGNFLNVLHSAQDPWAPIYDGFAIQKRFELEGIPLTCKAHGNEVWVRTVDDWGDNAGGCNEPCGQTRPCGHPCTINRLRCSQPCLEKLPCGHGCQNYCSQVCACDCVAFRAISAGNVAVGPSRSANASMSLERRMQQISIQEDGPPSQSIERDLTHASNKWRHFPANVQRHDVDLHRGQVSSSAQDALTLNVRDTYQQTTLVNGRRSNLGARNVRAIQSNKSNRRPPRSQGPSPVKAGTGNSRNNAATPPAVQNVASQSPAQYVTDQVPATQQQQQQAVSNPVPASDVLVDFGEVVSSQHVMVNRVSAEAPVVAVQPAQDVEELLIEL